jgi:hypothetical protein
LNYFLLFKIIRKDFKTNSHIGGLNPARGRRPIGRGGLLWQPAVMASRPDWRGPAATRPGQLGRGVARTHRRGHRAVATRTAVGWHDRWRPTGRRGVGNPAGMAHAGRGESAGQEEKWCGSPKRSGVGEVSGRGRCSGVLMAEDDSQGRGQSGVDPAGW